MSQTIEEQEPVVFVIPRTLAKGESHVYSAIVSVICGTLVAAMTYWAFKTAFVNKVPQVQAPLLWMLTKTISIAIGVLAGTAVWVLGALPEVPIGYKGVPRFFGGRSEGFLFPEGENRSFIPGILGLEPVDVRTVLLSNEPGVGEIRILALAKTTPVALTTPQGDTINAPAARTYLVPVTLIVSAPRSVFNPYVHLNFQNPDGRNVNNITAAMRKHVVDKEVLELPKEKVNLTEHLKSVVETFYETGSMPGNVEVMDVIIPSKITDAAIRISIEEIQMVTEGRQGAALAATTAILRTHYPRLSDQELRNMVLAAADLAKLNVSSVEGGKGTSTLNIVGDGHHG